MNVKDTNLSLKGALTIGFWLGIWGIIAAIYAIIEGVENRLTEVESILKSERLTKVLYGQQ